MKYDCGQVKMSDVRTSNLLDPDTDSNTVPELIVEGRQEVQEHSGGDEC